MISLLSINVWAIDLVVVLPNLNQMILGGWPFRVEISMKSASKVTIQKSCFLAYCQISISVAFSRPDTLT